MNTGVPMIVENTGEALLRLLKLRGVDCLFANTGTDFPSLVEALAKVREAPAAVPRAFLVPHENLAVGMAHGYAMVSGKPQAVMVHVNVGTANALCGLINAARENVPMLLMAGRTPILEQGPLGSRSLTIHWAQEMYDQGGMVREQVKWDYELRHGSQLEPVLDRALAIAASEPAGPVYLTLPREVLAEALPDFAPADTIRAAPSAPSAPDRDDTARAARTLMQASCPVIITARAGRDPRAVAPLAAFAERHAIPVIEFRPRYLSLPSDHPMHGGFEVDPWLDQADALLVLDCDVPWVPNAKQPGERVPVIQVGIDPLFTRYPTRGFRSDITLASAPRLAIEALSTAMDGAMEGTMDAGYEARLSARRLRAAQSAAARRDQAQAAIERARRAQPMGFAWVSHCLAQAAGEDALYVNEYPLVRSVIPMRAPGGFFGSSPAGGLGWGLPAALGAKLAAPEKLVVAALGDGCYVFSNPVACHQMSVNYALPVLSVVFNNGGYGAVERATRAMYPHGHAMRHGMPLTWFPQLPRFDAIAQACGGYGERVEQAEALPGALERALKAVREERRHALLDVICA
jgi:acetolactate synthase-1/2/3 large subunit